ncbi:unnamed protein product [Alopecurus aequalis]
MPPAGSWFLVFVWVWVWWLQLLLVQAEQHKEGCPAARTCGSINISDPFWLTDWQTGRSCGSSDFQINCTDNNTTPVLRGPGTYGFEILNISYEEHRLHVVDQGNQKYLNLSGRCHVPTWNTSTKLAHPFRIDPRNLGLVFYNCTTTAAAEEARRDKALVEMGCGNNTFTFCVGGLFKGAQNFEEYYVDGCTPTFLPVMGSSSGEPNASDYKELIDGGFLLTWDPTPRDKKKGMVLGIGIGAPAGFVMVCFAIFVCYKRKKRKRARTSSDLMRSGSSMSSYSKDLEMGSAHIFTFEELEEATDGFNASRELGDGGFGTVYKGKLKDGRVVAVKRLYKNNYKRVEQFLNEVDILSRLLHQNLVILYGCTSRMSRDLLLVYEFIPNGTVADHLHGSRSVERGLTWPLRLNIAIETAEALSYLHAVEIIHRDVKTTNILLDNSFHVKVADFGLSRLFPLEVTHVSTVPQGTPGYVDPVYHQCYKLTDKSDVYSYGVVLVELISSKPAVDMSRSHSEINLANMALNRIQNHEVVQLVDPELGYHTDSETKSSIDRVAEVAFQCLQLDRELRPSIKEVVEILNCIRDGDCPTKSMSKDASQKEDVHLLRGSLQFSPNSVIHRFHSQSTNPSVVSNSSEV